MNVRPRQLPIVSRSAFTLIELMIAVALMLIMMISINQIFRTTGETVGAGNALSTIMRDRRAAFSAMADDFNSVTADGPCFIIRSSVVPAFLDANDKNSDTDWPTAGRVTGVQTITDANGATYTYPFASLSSRTHRADIVSFFARNFYKRQTGTDNTYGYFGTNTTHDAWIEYAHARLPIAASSTASIDYRDPGADYNPALPLTGTDPNLPSNNPNNYYARNWILGRKVVLLRDTYLPAGGETIMNHTLSNLNETPTTPAALQYPNITPLSIDGNWSSSRVYTSRFDLAGSTMEQFATTFANFLQYYPKSQWWRLADDYVIDPTYQLPDRTGGAEVPGNLKNADPKPSGYTPDTTLVYRFHCNPFVQKPLTAAQAALESTYFLGGCSQFAVEYAGDYVTQDALGNVTKSGADGTIDFVIPTLASGVPDKGVRKIRWYGLPRDTNGDGVIFGRTSTAPGNARGNNDLPDVIPLRDILAIVNAPPALFERYDANTSPTIASHNAIPMLSPRTDYGLSASGAAPAGGMAAGDTYTCAWQFATPKMIRIVMQLEDANGRIVNSTPFEFVFSIQP